MEIIENELDSDEELNGAIELTLDPQKLEAWAMQDQYFANVRIRFCTARQFNPKLSNADFERRFDKISREEYIKAFRRRFDENPYGFYTSAGTEKLDKSWRVVSVGWDVILTPRQILSFLEFEAELKKEEYNVRFDREAEPC